ncbi:MAG: diaminopropionate ammonia-lyase [Desulfovibrio sp. MES5]|uniref:diaminopropionate ammonia-lyase n=1 Tax=Desulfovibrio sp. MES5 TaxID=1899016 RepID=UPI000B9D1008|nr:diaminopropionate ammonia-lyase [Desulfovibrio sp. MES5]OXS29608.1 MAG: diaminopropionate ammonia-lyase [Desulfovibrio sp. MES5]
MKTVSYGANSRRASASTAADVSLFGPEEARKARSFHQGFGQYAATPLVRLEALAAHLGLAEIQVKDESRRFGLNAFKVLGGSYAVARYLAQRLDIPMQDVNPDLLRSAAVREKLGDMTLVTATDGNHGLGVAWTARQLGMKAMVFMPAGSAPVRAENIRNTGAGCVITECNYDDAVRLAMQHAADSGGVLVQDTAWDGYEEVPLWIMQGYTTLALEADEQWQNSGAKPPTHMFLQAGVGSFAAAVLGYFVSAMGHSAPRAVIVEPQAADCYYRSFMAADGAAHSVAGHMRTIMAGLACGEPSSLCWPILRDRAVAALSCADTVAANGMRILAAPLQGDAAICSGESGAAPLGALEHVMRAPEMEEVRQALGLDDSSRVLLFSTEGDTSPDLYRQIVWYGRHGAEACGV